MRRIIICFLIIGFVLYQTGCSGQQVSQTKENQETQPVSETEEPVVVPHQTSGPYISPDKNPNVRYRFGWGGYAYQLNKKRKLEKNQRAADPFDGGGYISGGMVGKESTVTTQKDTVYVREGALCLYDMEKTNAKKIVFEKNVTLADNNYICDEDGVIVMPEYDSWFHNCPDVESIEVTPGEEYTVDDEEWEYEPQCRLAAGDLYVKNNLLMYRHKSQGVFACPIPQKGVVTIPDKTKILYDSVFLRCRSITKVKIPASVKKVGSAVFGYNSKLKEIVVDKSSKYLKSIDGVLYSRDGKVLYAYPSGKKDKVFRVPDQVCAIADGAFIGAANLKKVIIPSKTFYVGIKCFMDCKQLREVRSEEKIKYIMDTAFINCKKIEKYPRIKGDPKLEGSLYFVPESCRVIKN